MLINQNQAELLQVHPECDQSQLAQMKRKGPYFFESLEEEWQCSISCTPMKQPVITQDGHSYERTAIQGWLRKQNTSPITGMTLSSTNLIQNIALRNVILKFNTSLKQEFANLCNQNEELLEKVSQLEQKIKEYAKIQKEYLELKKKYEDLAQSSKVVVESYLNCQQTKKSLESKNIELQKENLKLKENLMPIQLSSTEKKEQKEVSPKLLNKKFAISVEEQNQKTEMRQEQIIEPKQYTFSNFLDQLLNKYQNPKFSQISEEKPEKIRHIMPFQDYFLNCGVLYDKGVLDHSGNTISMQEFLRYNWSELEILNLNNTFLDDQGLEMLVSEGAQFKSLTDLLLCNHLLSIKGNNLIQNLPSYTFEKFPNLKRIYMNDFRQSNSLTSQSISYVKNFQNSKPGIQMIFE